MSRRHCSASLSNLLGIVLTPVLVTAFLVTQTGGAVSLAAIRDILLQLLVPFVAGQLVTEMDRRIRGPTQEGAGYVDRGSILLVV